MISVNRAKSLRGKGKVAEDNKFAQSLLVWANG